MENIASHSGHGIDVLSYKEGFDREFDFEVVYGDYSSYIGLLRLFWDISSLSGDYDKIYFDKPDDAWTAAIASLRGIDIVSHAHGSETYIDIVRLRSYLRKFLFRLSIEAVDDFIPVSRFTGERLKKHGAKDDEVHVVHNGVDFERFNKGKSLDRSKLDIAEDSFLIITVSRLHQRKGHDLVIEAIKDLEDVHYLIVGTGEMENELREKAKSLGVSDRVTFAGFVDAKDLPDFYATADVFAMPSKHMEKKGGTEGFPLVFLEANAAGKPVIGSNAGGSPDAIKDGETGFIADTSYDIKRKITKLKDNEGLRKDMEKNAVEWAREHKWPKIVDKIDHILAR
jgi:phosphatidylinositol alpha-1,6-mannosyltransferase